MERPFRFRLWKCLIIKGRTATPGVFRSILFHSEDRTTNGHEKARMGNHRESEALWGEKFFIVNTALGTPGCVSGIRVTGLPTCARHFSADEMLCLIPAK